MDKEKMKAEALKRLEILVANGLLEDAKESFEQGKPCFSKPVNVLGEPTGVTFSFSEKPELQYEVVSFENRNNVLVYYGIYNETDCGNMLSLLFVSEDEDEWEMDREDLIVGYPLAYVRNISEDFGEIGSIGIEMGNGGLLRTC